MPPENSKKKEGVCPYRCVPSSGAQIIYIIEKTLSDQNRPSRHRMIAWLRGIYDKTSKQDKFHKYFVGVLGIGVDESKQ